jgi:hypothetical protein
LFAPFRGCYEAGGRKWIDLLEIMIDLYDLPFASKGKASCKLRVIRNLILHAIGE